MDWKKSLGYGVGIYVIIFIFWSLLVAFGQGEAAWGWYASFGILAAVAHYAGAKLGTKNVKEILTYSASWVVVTAILDAVITTRFTGWEFYSSWEIYVAYAILLLVPLSVLCCEGRCCHTSSSTNVEDDSDDNVDDQSQEGQKQGHI